MEKMLFLLLAGGRGERLKPLTNHSPKPIVRFGDSSRIIDFTLYNCLASGKGESIVLSQYLCENLENYIDVHWKPAFALQGSSLRVLSSGDFPKRVFAGTADAVYQALVEIDELPRHVMVLASDHIYKMDYRSMIEFHRSHGKTATVGAIECDRNQAHRFGIINAGEGGRIVCFHEKPKVLDDSVIPNGKPLASMGIYVFTVGTLLDYLEKNQRQKSYDFGGDVLPEMANQKDAYSYRFVNSNGQRGYWRDIGEIPSYWQASMELLNGAAEEICPAPLSNLANLPFSKANLIKKHITGGKKIFTSLISETARIGAARIENSVIAHNVHIKDNAVVRQSVVLDNVVIREDAILKHMIVGEDFQIKVG